MTRSTKYISLCLILFASIMGGFVWLQRGISEDFGTGFSIGLIIGIMGVFLLSRNAQKL